MRLVLAFQVFFKVLFQRAFADSIRALKAGPATSEPQKTPREKPISAPKPKPGRSDAITLLATLQREARLIDIVKEPLADYSDEQIGAAARDVLRESAKVLERLFDIQPLSEAEEGSSLEAPENHDPQQYHLIGNVTGEGPISGQMTHHGWTAKKCEVPQWNGKPDSKNIIAPIEIQV